MGLSDSLLNGDLLCAYHAPVALYLVCVCSPGSVLARDRKDKMLSLQKPSAEKIYRFLDQQAKLDLTYSAVGATATTPPSGYVSDHTQIKLGEGKEIFQAASAALRRWEQFHLGWLEARPTETPIQTGQVVAVLARAMGLWWLNACRIVYVVDETGPISKFGFAYGTLPAHAGTGEERFLVKWDQNTNEVHYEILAFSRMKHVLTRLGYPVVRRTQKQFGRDSAASMFRAVNHESPLPQVYQSVG